MAASETEIVNIALARIGEKSILALTDDSDRARVASALFAVTRDEVLAAGEWNEATKRDSLAQLAGSPKYGFARQFQIPPDCLRILETDDDSFPWRREGNTLVTDRSSVSIKYIFRLTDPTKFSPALTSALAYRLASDMAETIAGKASLQKLMLEKYGAALVAARGVNTKEGGNEQHPGTPKEQTRDTYQPLLDARY